MFPTHRHRLIAVALFLALGASIARAADTRVRSRLPSLAQLRQRVPQFPADVKAHGERLWNAASPAVKSWASQSALGIAKGTGDAEFLARTAVQARWSHVRAAGSYDALAFLTNYEAAKALQTDINDALDSVKNKLDSLSEMGETESLRLQMAMDRLSKLMSTLSNTLKRISDTDAAIVGNLK